MDMILANILEALLPIIITALSGFLTWLGTRIKKYYDEKAKDETVRKIIDSTVKYVEQVYKDVHGSEKLDQAKDIATSWLREKGIEITDAELTILVESFVNGLNNK